MNRQKLYQAKCRQYAAQRLSHFSDTTMTLTIDLPEAEVTAPAAKARARGVSAEQYASAGRDLAPDWLRRSWESATQAGLNRLSMDEIDAETAAARKARRESHLNPSS